MTNQELQQRLAITKINIAEAGGKIIIKRGWFWKSLHWIVFVVTLGGNRKFLTDYYTTIGPWVGVPEDWEDGDMASIIAVLEHESIHIAQCKRFGLGSVYLGLPIFGFLYLFCLPAGLAYFRWRFERAAYAHGINIKLELLDPVRMDPARMAWHRKYLIDSAVKQLTTGRYMWTWPFPGSVRRYFERHTMTTAPPSHLNCRCVLSEDLS